MQRISRLMISALATAGLYMMSAGTDVHMQRTEAGRMKNVVLVTAEPTQAAFAPQEGPEIPVETERIQAEQPEELRAFILPEENRTENFTAAKRDENVLETTIEGGMRIKNETGYYVDAAELLGRGPGIKLEAEGPQMLIIHTHSSEAYTQAGLDRYVPSDTNRTEDTQFNIVRIGDELTEILIDCGLNVIHDRGIYDYPSYTGSYSRSAAAIEQYLESYPTIQIVLDIHRDALGSDGVVYKTMAEEDGSCASQIMLLAGSDDSGLHHPGWQNNLALALYLQNAVVQQNPTLMRPVSLVKERYNQHLSPGSLIVEVGSSGNTLQEALAAIRLFGKAVGPEIFKLISNSEE